MDLSSQFSSHLAPFSPGFQRLLGLPYERAEQVRNVCPDLSHEVLVARRHARVRPALDPVDGTANFVHGIPLVAVSLGLLQAGKQVLGVVDLPILDERYAAVEAGGAVNRAGRIGVRQTRGLSEAIVSIGDYAVGPESAEKNRARYALTIGLAEQVQRVRMLGSAAIDLVWVAEGKLDACVMLANKPWDTAAGVAIAREAGALVVDLDGSPHTASSYATIAMAPGIADAVLALVQEATQAKQ